ncbi:Hypothetical predicted protein [Octopus vulgaris]|uniref:Uncharacterized protein n=1 Tax=Octopus vulgaris TaxID=6645 RepID=A0AA36BNV1_OCTVU|nr:Hypothetical predicted protein [Octopus vulgaris]
MKVVDVCRKQPEPPDGGWGWVVCLAAACNSFTVVFLTNPAGILLIGLRRTFQDPVSKLSLISGLLSGLSMLSAPIASILLNYLSHRTVLILSGLIAFTGAILGAFSTSLDMMIVTYGLITGVAIGMIYFTSHVITGLYFKKKRALALGITNCGGGDSRSIADKKDIVDESITENQKVEGKLPIMKRICSLSQTGPHYRNSWDRTNHESIQHFKLRLWNFIFCFPSYLWTGFRHHKLIYGRLLCWWSMRID